MPMKWITRANVKVDRVACPWLIRTFVDRDAEFLFAPVGEVESVARKTGAIPYDVAGVELGHHGEECSVDVIDSARDLYIESMPGLVAVAGALVSEARGLVFTSNRGENTVSVFSPHAERDAFKIVVGVKPNGLAFDPARGILIVANVGDASIPDSHSISVVDLARRERITEVKVPGRTRWAIYDAAGEMFFVNIASPARIIAIDARNPTKILKEYEVPAAGPHGLELDPATGRLLCACDAGLL